MIHLKNMMSCVFCQKHSASDLQKGSVLVMGTEKFKLENIGLQLLIKNMFKNQSGSLVVFL